MNPALRCLFLMLALSASTSSRAVEVVLAFTQLQDTTTSLYPSTRSQMIIGHLRRFNVDQVAVLVRTRDLNKPSIQARVKSYSDAGHLLVNLGHNHLFYSRPDIYRHQADLLRGHQRLQGFSGYRRHVMFAGFETDVEESHREKFERFARSKGMTPFNISVRVQDASLNLAYQQEVELKRKVDMRALQDAYVAMLWPDLVRAYYRQAVTGAGPLVVLLEEHDLTAYLLPGLLERIQSAGGKVVAPGSYFTYPPIYDAPANLHLSHGYISKLLQLPPQRLHQPLVLGTDKSKVDTYLIERGLLQ